MTISKFTIGLDKMFTRLDGYIKKDDFYGDLKPINKKIYSDIGNVIIKILETYRENLLLKDVIALEQRLLKITEILYNNMFSQYYVTFKWVNESDIDSIDNALNASIYDIQSTNVIIQNINRKKVDTFDSIFNLYMNRIKWVIDRCIEFINMNKNNSENVVKLYALTTIVNTFYNMRKKDKIKEKFDIDDYIYTINGPLLNEIKKDYLRKEPTLLAFISSSLLSNEPILENSYVKDTLLSICDIDPSDLSPYQNSWITINLWESNIDCYEKFGAHLSIASNYPPMTLAPFVLASFYMKYDLRKSSFHILEDLKIAPFFESISMNEIVKMFFPTIGTLELYRVTPEDQNKLVSMNDGEIRALLCSLLLLNPNLDESTKAIVINESKKPHSGYEISDMDIPITIEGKKHFVCLPVKSGVEIKSPSVPSDYLHQLTRPFLLYPFASCIFITAKPCSQPLRNQINALIQKQFPIYVIENQTLIRLFKSKQLM